MTTSATPEEVHFASNNNRYRFRGGYPALRVLIKERPVTALAVWKWLQSETDEKLEGAHQLFHMDPREQVVDDIDNFSAPEKVWGSLDELLEVQAAVEPVNIDRLHEITPPLHELLRSAGGIAWPWSGVRSKRDGKIRSVGEPWAYLWTVEQRRTDPNRRGVHVFELGGLTYYAKPEARRRHPGGMLVTFADDKGNIRRPNYKATKPRGGKQPYRAAAAVIEYLGLPGAMDSPMTDEVLRTPISSRSILMPMLTPLGRRGPGGGLDIHNKIDTLGRFGVEEAREYLKHYGVDGSVAFDALPFRATKCRPGTAQGARFIAGVSAGKETKSAPAMAGLTEPKVRLSDAAEIVLEEVAARGNLTRIGMRLGKAKGYADRYGKKALLAAADEIIALNDNVPKNLAA